MCVCITKTEKAESEAQRSKPVVQQLVHLMQKGVVLRKGTPAAQKVPIVAGGIEILVEPVDASRGRKEVRPQRQAGPFEDAHFRNEKRLPSPSRLELVCPHASVALQKVCIARRIRMLFARHAVSSGAPLYVDIYINLYTNLDMYTQEHV